MVQFHNLWKFWIPTLVPFTTQKCGNILTTSATFTEPKIILFAGDVKRMKHKSPKNSNFHISLEHFSFLVPDEFLSCCSLIVLHFCSVSWLTPYLFFLTHSRVQQLASIFLPIFSSFAFTFPYSLEYFSSNFSDLLLTYLSMSLSNVFLNGPSPASFIVYFRSF